MEQQKKSVNERSIIFALVHVATYLPAAWLLSRHVFAKPVSLMIAIVPIITFGFFILKLIKAFSIMDEVNHRVQFEAVLIGFSLTVMLIMLLFLLSLCGISNPTFLGYGYLVAYCWGFYFIGWIVSKRKYGV